ncbi:MAG: MFS family permease [Crocinitomix sp.]|jgi:MFS family permease
MSKFSAYFEDLKDYPRAFWVLCLNMLVFMASFNMILPELNEYLTDLGGADKKWMILGLWTLAAAAARPFSGKIADNISRKSVMYFGILVSILICFLYPYFLTVTGFLVLRFFHGFSTGFQPTGVTALIADIVPKGKRGEAMGIFGVTISLGFSGGLAMGSPIKAAIGMDGLFLTSALMGVFAFLLIFFVTEENVPYKIARANKSTESLASKIIPKWNEIFAPEVINPTVIMFLVAMCSGTYMMVVPDFSAHLGMDNKGMFYLVNLGFTVITRFVSGKFYDKFGAHRNLNIGLVLLIIGALLTGTSTTVTQFLMSGIVFGIAAGITSPALFAWTADLANPAFKGRGMSTMFIALELGIAAGNFGTQQIYNNDPANFLNLFLTLSLICLVGIVYLFFARRMQRANAVR